MKQNQRMIVRILTGICMIAIMLLIFSFSAQNGTESEGVSNKVVVWIQDVLLKPFGLNDKIADEQISFMIRKTAHFSIYAALGVSVAGFLASFPNLKRKWFLAWCLGTVYAMTDEIHQLFSNREKRTDIGCMFGFCWSSSRSRYSIYPFASISEKNQKNMLAFLII